MDKYPGGLQAPELQLHIIARSQSFWYSHVPVLTLKKRFGKWPLVFFLWAFFISYAQVYVGVHYPADVIAGGLIGILIGYLSGRSFNRNYGLA